MRSGINDFCTTFCKMGSMADSFDYVNTAPSSLKPKSYKLKFLNKVGPQVITGKNGHRGIKASGGYENIVVELVDSETGLLITDEPAASKTVRIVLLPEEFYGFSTRSQFETSIVYDYGSKKNILRGDLYVKLENGRGTIGKIWIKHDRNHLRKVKFRLGAMINVPDCSYEIKEAISEPFEVIDYRNVLTCKNNRAVKPNDKVSKLKNVGKTICKRFMKANIKNVANFLEMFNSNAADLQEIYGCKGKKFDETVQHAKTSLFVSDKNSSACGSTGSSSQGRGHTVPVENEGRAEVDIKSYEPSPSSNNTMPMTSDPGPLTVQDYEQLYYYDDDDEYLSSTSTWIGNSTLDNN
ncbi:calmodulin-binding protein 60 F-like [Rutidosis leptorrhynchoides]|uniref:calmodulin-binding protein 60 F-like n=1 Tax=Rutidosis leptorrhynchoides TaxID=125765 RepID=UPI003A98E071